MVNSPTRTPSWSACLRLAASLFGLNLALSFHNLWPTPWVTTHHELSVEAAALVLLMALYAEWRKPPSRRALSGLAIVLLVMVLGRYAEVTAPALYGRSINLFWDAQHLPKVAAMLAEAALWWHLVLAMAGAALILTVGFLALRWMLFNASRGLSAPMPRRVVIALTGGLVTLFLLGHLIPQGHALRWFSLPITLTYAEQASFLYRAAAADDRFLETEASPLAASNLERLAGVDVMVLFLESYGATTFDRPQYAQALARSRDGLSRAVDRSGRQAVSAFVRSPTFGGASWLAHSSFLSGIEVTDNGLYQLLLTRERETLVHRFARHGYRTLALMPGLRQAWPEGEFYGFEQIYDAIALDYRGPEFGWWRIPDQYALARLDALELEPEDRAPVMVVFTTISSHTPFRPTPPYQGEWQVLLEAEPFGPETLAERLSQAPDWTNLGPAYVDAVDYALTYVAGYLETRAPKDLVLIVVGDHQPPASVSGPGVSWDVPVHVIASRPELMDALLAEGFQLGLEPSRPVIGLMHELTAKLLRAFAGDPGPTSAAQPRRRSKVLNPGSRDS